MRLTLFNQFVIAAASVIFLLMAITARNHMYMTPVAAPEPRLAHQSTTAREHISSAAQQQHHQQHMEGRGRRSHTGSSLPTAGGRIDLAASLSHGRTTYQPSHTPREIEDREEEMRRERPTEHKVVPQPPLTPPSPLSKQQPRGDAAVPAKPISQIKPPTQPNLPPIVARTVRVLDEAFKRGRHAHRTAEAAAQELLAYYEGARSKQLILPKPTDPTITRSMLCLKTHIGDPKSQFAAARTHLPFKANTGVRYGHLISQGLELHPWVTLTDKADDADLVVWLPNSSPDKANAVHSLPDKKSRLVVLDEGDHPGVWSGFKEGEYLSYFKRSWVQKKNGTSFGKSGRNRFSHAFYPAPYSVSDNYTGGLLQVDRDLSIVCTIRWHAQVQPARTRVFQWVTEAVKELGVESTSQIGDNTGHRKSINTQYFDWMRRAHIVVTCNPSNWDGDFRLWEAMGTGALVFVDESHTPVANPPIDGEHIVVYNNHDREDLVSKLRYYVEHPEEAREIALRGYLHAMRYHRTVARIDYVLRSSIDHQREERSEGPLHPGHLHADHVAPSTTLVIRQAATKKLQHAPTA